MKNPILLAAKAVKLIIDPVYRFNYLNWRGLCDTMPDAKYLSLLYRSRMGIKLNLKNPKTLCEKIQWLKLYNRKPEYTAMVDKYAVKKLVADSIGPEYVIPLLGVYDSFDDIDFDALPEQFILKCSHDSGGFAICLNKSSFDNDKAREILNRSLSRNYYIAGREWVYKNVPPRIIAEKYIASLGNPNSIEYKISCFNGKAKLITICQGPAHNTPEERLNDHYDENLQPLQFWTYYKNPAAHLPIPEQIHKMISLSEKLASGIPYVRVDWYIIDGKIFFGEFTFYTHAGFMKFNPPEWDEILGSWLELPKK